MEVLRIDGIGKSRAEVDIMFPESGTANSYALHRYMANMDYYFLESYTLGQDLERWVYERHELAASVLDLFPPLVEYEVPDDLEVLKFPAMA